MGAKVTALGETLVIKESGGKFFLSSVVPWAYRGVPGVSRTKALEKRPDRVVERNRKFTEAADVCDSAGFGKKKGTVWNASKYNQCVGLYLQGKSIEEIKRILE